MAPEEFVKKAREEIVTNMQVMQKFHETDDVLEILKLISAYSARATWMAMKAAKSTSPIVEEFVYKELNRFSQEVSQQFAIWSRIEAVMNREWAMTK